MKKQLSEINENFRVDYAKRKIMIAEKFKLTTDYLLGTEKLKVRLNVKLARRIFLRTVKRP